MKKIIAIACFAAFTTAGISSTLSAYTNPSVALTPLGDKDKDKDKKKNKEKATVKSCCSKNTAEAKSCSDSKKTTDGKTVTAAGAGSTETVKACCKKDGDKSCDKEKAKK